MSEKEFPPSIKRLQKARKDGKIVRSQMVTVAVGWWALLSILFPTFAWVRDGTLIQWLNYKAWTPEVAFVEASWLGGKIIALLVGVVGCSGVAVGLAQSKGLFLPSQLLQGAQQYQPGAYVGRVKQHLIDVSLGILRCGLILALVLPAVITASQITPSSFPSSSEIAFQKFYTLIKRVFLQGGYGLLVIAVIAYVLARWRFFKQLKMSLQDVKDEHKEDEGDPHVKSARKHEHRMLLFSEIEKRVKQSRVVIVRRTSGGERNE